MIFTIPFIRPLFLFIYLFILALLCNEQLNLNLLLASWVVATTKELKVCSYIQLRDIF